MRSRQATRCKVRRLPMCGEVKRVVGIPESSERYRRSPIPLEGGGCSRGIGVNLLTPGECVPLYIVHKCTWHTCTRCGNRHGTESDEAVADKAWKPSWIRPPDPLVERGSDGHGLCLWDAIRQLSDWIRRYNLCTQMSSVSKGGHGLKIADSS